MNELLLRLQFQRPTDWVGREIAKNDNGEFSHVELEFTFLGNNDAGESLSFSSHLLDGGTRFKHINFSDPIWEPVEVKLSADDVEKVRQFCELNAHKKYDLGGVLAFKAPLLFHSNSTEYFCSEVCLAALEQAVPMTDKRPDVVTPNALYRISKGLPAQ